MLTDVQNCSWFGAITHDVSVTFLFMSFGRNKYPLFVCLYLEVKFGIHRVGISLAFVDGAYDD